jgi:hypothetical protein
VSEDFSPLDEELELLAGQLTPSLQESLVRLGVWMPFARAATEFKYFTHVKVSEPTTRRLTEAAGAAYVAVQTEEVKEIERSLPVAPRGASKVLLSVDGAMVPLVHGEWAEVKTLLLGRIGAAVKEKDEWVVHAEELSYFSRLTDAETFGHLALVETHRRGLEHAEQVAAVTDGAEWEQKFIDLHREDAVRILDFPHAGERISPFGQLEFGEGTPEYTTWEKEQLHKLKHDGPSGVLMTLRSLQEKHPEASLLSENLAYLEKREAHMQYPVYRAQGLPIASGGVESGNKLVVEARLKGAGMRWARCNVNPMVALRNMVCSDRWDEDWPRIVARLRQNMARRSAERRQQRRILMVLPAEEPSLSFAPVTEPEMVCQPTPPPPPTPQPEPALPPTTKRQPHRPGPDHPWRHSPIGRARYHPDDSDAPAKT